MLYSKNSIKSYFIIIVATLLLYMWQLHLYPMINPDGVTYIEAAAAYLKGGFKAAVDVDSQAKWPFYSILIAKVYSFSGLSLVAAERILDIFFICGSACLFLFLVRLFSQHRYAGFWAILIWITWHEYIKWWPAIVRDHGFLTSLLLSFYCYYRYTLTHRFIWAFAWTFCVMVAEFFRIEAVIYLLLIPFSVFFLTGLSLRYRLLLWLKLNVLTCIAGISVILLFLNQILTLDSLRFAYMWQEFSLLFVTMFNEFMLRYHIVHTSIFYRESYHVGYALLVAYMIAFVMNIIIQISLAVVLSLIFVRRALKKLNAVMLKQAFSAYLCVTGLIPLFFFAEHVFLNGRYLLPIGLILLLLVASALPHIIESFSGKRKIIFVGLISVLLSVNFVANIFLFGRVSQDYYIVGTWLKENYPNQSIFTNNKIILFYDSSSPDYRHGQVCEMWRKGVKGTGAAWLRQHDSWCDENLLVLTAMPDQARPVEEVYKKLQKVGAVGSIIKRYEQVAGGIILVAPINTEKCRVYVKNQNKLIVEKPKTS